MKYKLAILLLGSAMCFQGAVSQYPIKFDVTELQESVKFSEIFDDIQYISLETNEACYLSFLHQIQFDDLLIFFQDFNKNEVFVFDMLGHFKNRIGIIGKGPGEIIAYADFILDKEKNQIEILDAAKAQVIIYSYSGKNYNLSFGCIKKVIIYSYSGKFLGTKNLISAGSIEKTHKGNYMAWSDYWIGFQDRSRNLLNTTPLILLDDNGKTINKFKTEFKPFALGSPGITTGQNIIKLKDTLIFYPDRSTLIYSYYETT